jgi:hypothetical protein
VANAATPSAAFNPRNGLVGAVREMRQIADQFHPHMGETYFGHGVFHVDQFSHSDNGMCALTASL